MIQEIQQFYEGKDTKPISFYLNQFYEQISVNKSWLSRDRKNVRKWLKNHF